MCNPTCKRCVIWYSNWNRSFNNLLHLLVWTSLRKWKRYTDKIKRCSWNRVFPNAYQIARKSTIFKEILINVWKLCLENMEMCSKMIWLSWMLRVVMGFTKDRASLPNLLIFHRKRISMNFQWISNIVIKTVN